MVKRDELEIFLNTLMKIDDFEDYGPNGLQIEGKADIRKIAFSVSFSLEVAQQAVEKGVDAIFVHHGQFWKSNSPVITGSTKNRISLLLKNDINLFAYHLPLDFLPEYGNNHHPLSKLGAEKILPFANTGYLGELKKSLPTNEFAKWLEQYYGSPGIYVIPQKMEKIKSVVFVSGGGQSFFQEAIQTGADAFVTGEGSEWVYNMARENEVAYFAMGHYNSEIIGPREIGKLLEKKFDLTCEFIREKNPF